MIGMTGNEGGGIRSGFTKRRLPGGNEEKKEPISSFISKLSQPQLR